MADILEEIVAWKRLETERMKLEIPETQLRERIEGSIESMYSYKCGSMAKALAESDSGIIAEFKRKSPSKGWIKEQGKASEIPLAYQQNGAAAVSILTDERYFGGCDAFIDEARRSGVNIPILYKNFVIDEYQLYQACSCGASAVLLIAACLSKKECALLMASARQLHLEVLLEMHSERELEYAELEPDMCGINNRNLGTFVTDTGNSFRFAELLPQDAVKVSESGISDRDTVRQLRQAGYRGFLIGENFMKTNEPGEALNHFINNL
jgi:indole-3-glycerol phosphate synthase